MSFGSRQTLRICLETDGAHFNQGKQNECTLNANCKAMHLTARGVLVGMHVTRRPATKKRTMREESLKCMQAKNLPPLRLVQWEPMNSLPK